MRKIVLGCAAVLLSLGLLAGCNNEENDKVVSIKVDNTATVVVGESLALPYTVEPEKAKVEVLNDHEEYVTASADAGLLCLDGLAEGSATVTLVGTYKKYEEANVNISVSVVPESTAEQGPGPETGGTEEVLLGSFDFSTNEKNGTAISSSSDLDEFWSGEDIYKGVSEYDTVYLGNGTGGAFENETKLIKFGTGFANGTLQLKFAVGTCIDKVVLTAHSWYKVSEEYPDQEPNQLIVNGESQDCSVSGTATELTYTISGDLERFITFESVGRVTIHSIDVYGTYEPDRIDPITELTLTADPTELNVAETTKVTVTWEPETTIFDIDELVWTTSSEDVASVTQSSTGAQVRGEGDGKATITATAPNGIYGTIDVSVEDVLQESESLVLADIEHGYSGNTKTGYLYGHQTKITIDQNSDNGGNSNAPSWSNSSVRVYSNQTITFTPLYEEATITSVEITCEFNSGSNYYVGNSTATLKTSSGEDAGTITRALTSPTLTFNVSTSEEFVYTNYTADSKTENVQLRLTAITIYYTLTEGD